MIIKKLDKDAIIKVRLDFKIYSITFIYDKRIPLWVDQPKKNLESRIIIVS